MCFKAEVSHITSWEVNNLDKRISVPTYEAGVEYAFTNGIGLCDVD